MLTQTFCHVAGIGRDTERALWEQGCRTWQDLLSGPERFRTGNAARELAVAHIQRSVECLETGCHQFFRPGLGMREAWRAWPEFRDKCVYLDIETDGGRSGNAVTTIGLYDGREYRCLVKGQDLDSFRDIISHYSMIVTFFGAGFDLPMLQKRFRGLEFDQIHIDLCPTLRELGYRGGLKRIEKELGIAREGEIDGLNGLDAVRLWRDHQRGSERALETLIEYNRADVVNLERLAEIAYDGLRRATLGSFALVS